MRIEYWLQGPRNRDYWTAYNRGDKYDVTERWGLGEMPNAAIMGATLYDPVPDSLQRVAYHLRRMG